MWSNLFLTDFWGKSTPEKVSVCKAFRAFWFFCSNYPHLAPKCSALPTGLHPEIFDFIFVSGQTCGQRDFLRIFMKTKTAKKSVFTRVFSGFEFFKWIRYGTLPKQARYQLRYIPIYVVILYFSFLLITVVRLRFLLQHRFCLHWRSPITVLLPLLYSRLFRHRRRSKTSPTALHPDICC